MSAATTVRVPASCANLGPGFDTLGVALEIYLQCQFQPAGELKITAHGRDAAFIPLDDSNLIWQTRPQSGWNSKACGCHRQRSRSQTTFLSVKDLDPAPRLWSPE